jgi:acyl carrier protein
MDRANILDALKVLMQERFDVKPEGLHGHTRQNDIGIDSILLVDLMLDIESKLDFTFENMDLPRNPSLDEIVDLVEANMGRPAG